MKKLLSVLLAVAMLMSMSAMALAEESSLLTDTPVTITFMRAENSAIPIQDNVPSTQQIL